MNKRAIIVPILIKLFMPVKAQYSINRMIALDSVIAVASEKYRNPSIIKSILIGSNYTKEWSTEVKMPVFKLSQSGMKIKELGGGQQTKSLKLEDQKGREWALRTVEKDAAGAVPKGLKGTLAQKIVDDLISGSYPYAPLIVGSLAKSVGIVAPDPVLYYIPSDAGLGQYQNVFTGKVCFLEEKEPTIKGSNKTESTAEVQEDIIEENDQIVLQRQVLKARLLDMLIADWDRHSDQWRWGIMDSTNARYFYAIPRDHDQAFFMANGLIPRVGKFISMHHINWFKNEAKGLQWLSYKSWNFDRTFLNDLDASEWEKATKEFMAMLTDQVIASAVRKLPGPIYSIRGKELELKLISRRNSLLKNVMKYYGYISRSVQVNGSNEGELFVVSGVDGMIKISVYSQGTAGKKDIKIYERKFRKAETSFIYLMGYNGNDKYIIDSTVHSKIKIYLYGGDGKDEYNVQGRIKNVICDQREESNIIAKSPDSKLALK